MQKSNVISIYKGLAPTEQWKIDAANVVNTIRRNRELRDYSEAMLGCLFSLVELNVSLLWVYVALIGQFVLESKKIG